MKSLLLALLAVSSFSLLAGDDLSRPSLVVTTVKGDHANFRNDGKNLYINTPMLKEQNRGADVNLLCNMMEFQIKQSMKEIAKNETGLNYKVVKKVSFTNIGFENEVFRCNIFVMIDEDSNFSFKTNKTENFYLADKGGDPHEDAGLHERAHEILATDSSTLNYFNVDRVSFTRKYNISSIQVISNE